jgi:hypothetical protein
MSLTATRAPEAWNRRAISSPTPRPAPVTSAVRPWKSKFTVLLLPVGMSI